MNHVERALQGSVATEMESLRDDKSSMDQWNVQLDAEKERMLEAERERVRLAEEEVKKRRIEQIRMREDLEKQSVSELERKKRHNEKVLALEREKCALLEREKTERARESAGLAPLGKQAARHLASLALTDLGVTEGSGLFAHRLSACKSQVHCVPS